MKRKQAAAVFLAGILGVSTVTMPVFAEALEITADESMEETVETEAEPQETPVEEPVVSEEEGQTEQEEASDPAASEEEASETGTEAPAEEIKEETVEETAPEEEETAKVTATETVSDEAALKEKIANAADGEITVITVSGTVEISQTVTIPSGKKISIITLEASALLKRADSMKGDLFTAESGSFLTFLGAGNAKLTLDGSGAGVTGSLIHMKQGSQVSVTGNVALTGNKTTEAKAGAITNEGGLLVLDGGTISENQGAFGAVYTEADVILGSPASDFDPDPVSEITITGNQNAAGENGNLVLAGTDSQITVAGTLEASKVAVSFDDIESREETIVLTSQGTEEVAELIEQSISLDEVAAYADYSIDADGVLQKAGEPVTYTLSFDTRGGSEIVSQTVESGSVNLNELVSDPTREGYTFNGWHLNEDASDEAVTSLDITDNKTLYAGWTENPVSSYTVILDKNGGETVSPETLSVKEGDSVVLSSAVNATREGYTFTGWYTDASTTDGTKVDDTYTVTADVTLYAGWAADTVTYQVTFDLNLGESDDVVDPVAPVTVAEGGTLDLAEITDPVRTGYEFIGWYASPEAAADETASTVESPLEVTEDTILYAKWMKVYAVTFNVNGGDEYEEDPSYQVEAGEETDISDIAAPTRQGYQFTGWYLTPEADGDPVEDTFEVNEDMILYAGWAKEVTLTYNTNGGNEISEEKAAAGTVLSLKTPRRTGYAFAGWFISSDLSGTALGRTLTISEDTTVYAKWTESYFTLSFDSNGGSSVDALPVAAGVSFDLTAVEEPARDGYNFTGWYLSIGDTTDKSKAVGDSITIDKDTVLYAGWERKPIISDVLDSTITGLDGVLKFGLRITSSGKVQGDSVNFTAVGAGQDIASPVAGDERWVPICWNMDPNKYNAYTNSSGATVSADRRDEGKNGNYTLTLNPTKAAIDNYLTAAKENPSLLEDPEYFGSASNPKTKAAVYVYFRRQVYEEGSGWVDKNVKYIKKPLRYYMVLEKESGEEYTQEEIRRVVSTGGGVDALANENDPESTGSTTSDGAKTADESPVRAMSLLLAASFLTGCGVVFHRRKKETAENKK